MRSAVLAGSVCLLTAGIAVGQTPPTELPPTLPPAGPLSVYPAPVQSGAPVPQVAPGTAIPGLPDFGSPPPGNVAAPNIPLDDPWAITGPNGYASVDYAMWWYTPMNSVPLISTVPTAFAVATPPPGVTQTYFPVGNRISFNKADGVRLNAGLNWQRWGVDFSGFVLERRSKASGLFNAAVPEAVGQTYTSAGTGGQTVLYASLPNQYIGGVRVATESQIWGAEANVRHAFYVFLTDSTDILTGLRYFALQESVTMNSPSFFPNGTSLSVTDSFRTQNSFYGWQVGFNKRVGGYNKGWGLDVTTKTGIGGIRQQVDVVGSNTFTAPGFPPDTEPGGLYARGLNLGRYTRTRFGVMQDLDIRVTYNLGPSVQLFAGYTLFYLSSVMRPTEAIDPVVNDGDIRYIANTTPSVLNRPNFIWKGTGFVVQGITMGFRLQY